MEGLSIFPSIRRKSGFQLLGHHNNGAGASDAAPALFCKILAVCYVCRSTVPIESLIGLRAGHPGLDTIAGVWNIHVEVQHPFPLGFKTVLTTFDIYLRHAGAMNSDLGRPGHTSDSRCQASNALLPEPVERTIH